MPLGSRPIPPQKKFRLYWAAQPPPDPLGEEQLQSLIPVDFGSEEDALYAAALLIRSGQFVWRITRPEGEAMQAAEVQEKCAPIVDMLRVYRGPEPPSE